MPPPSGIPKSPRALRDADLGRRDYGALNKRQKRIDDMRMKTGSAFLLASALVCGATAARAAPPAESTAWQGVWRGTIGGAAVQVCLQHTDYNDFGAYYYMRHLQIISLGKLDRKAGAPAGPTWTEAPFSDKADKGPLWHITAVGKGRIDGVWTDGGKSLPIALTAVARDTPAKGDDDQPCGSQAFSGPRFTKPVVTTRPAKIDGIAYNRVLVDIGKQFTDSGFETFQLLGTTPAIRRINAELYKDVPTGPDHADYFQCTMAALGQNGLDGDTTSTLSPETLTPSFMVEADSESDDCGGAHPNADTSYRTWDLRTGTKIDLYGGFTKAALTRTVHDAGTKNAYDEVTLTPAFKAMVLAAFPADDPDCKEAVATADNWAARLTPQGVAFTPALPHVVAACIDDAVIPFAKLAPFLTADGKAFAALFQAETKGRK